VQNQDSITETFAATQLRIHNKRWDGVPIVLKTGKALAAKTTEITVCFRSEATQSANCLTFRLQPNEGITLELQAKQPGFSSRMAPVDMQFDYATAFQERQPDAYERVLVDALHGDRTLFATSEEVLAAWHIMQGVVSEWTKGAEGLEVYEPGSNGPHSPVFSVEV
jgi:glucose-6-phosphate 1-dehydrogenase